MAPLPSLATIASLAGRTAIVTGSSSGLGRATALRLAHVGATVVCADLDAETRAPDGASGVARMATHELIAANGGRGFFQQLDVTDLEAMKRTVAFAVSLSSDGRLDIMVNNAGTGGHQNGALNLGIHTEDPNFARRVLDINVMGVWNGTKTAVCQMLNQDAQPLPADLDVHPELGDPEPESQPFRGSRGTIINIGSIHGMVAGPAEPAYSASKAAVINLSRTVAADYAAERINCNVISPGYCAAVMAGATLPDNIVRRRVVPWPHQGAARDIAKAVIYLARDAPWVTGAVLAVDGGTTAV